MCCVVSCATTCARRRVSAFGEECRSRSVCNQSISDTSHETLRAPSTPPAPSPLPHAPHQATQQSQTHKLQVHTGRGMTAPFAPHSGGAARAEDRSLSSPPAAPGRPPSHRTLPRTRTSRGSPQLRRLCLLRTRPTPRVPRPALGGAVRQDQPSLHASRAPSANNPSPSRPLRRLTPVHGARRASPLLSLPLLTSPWLPEWLPCRHRPPPLFLRAPHSCAPNTSRGPHARAPHVRAPHSSSVSPDAFHSVSFPFQAYPQMRKRSCRRASSPSRLATASASPSSLW